MFEKILDIIKIVFEKYFLSSLFSIVVAGMIFYYTPNNFSILEKFGKKFYFVFCFSLVLFIVELTKKIFISLKKIYSKKRQLSEYNAQIFDRNKNEIYNSLDTLSPHELDVVQYFVDNNNNEITTALDYSDLELWRIGWIDHRSYKVKEKSIISLDVYDITKKVSFRKNSYVMQFKLKKEIYDALVLIKEKYGKISRF